MLRPQGRCDMGCRRVTCAMPSRCSVRHGSTNQSERDHNDHDYYSLCCQRQQRSQLANYLRLLRKKHSHASASVGLLSALFTPGSVLSLSVLVLDVCLVCLPALSRNPTIPLSLHESRPENTRPHKTTYNPATMADKLTRYVLLFAYLHVCTDLYRIAIVSSDKVRRSASLPLQSAKFRC
jgi:hypothetical protein